MLVGICDYDDKERDIVRLNKNYILSVHAYRCRCLVTHHDLWKIPSNLLLPLSLPRYPCPIPGYYRYHRCCSHHKNRDP